MSLIKDQDGNELKELNQIIDLHGQNVLEIGCGDGRLTWLFSPLTNFVAGIDVDQIDLAQAGLALTPDLQHKVGFACSDGQKIPFPNQTFDVGILSWSF